MAQILVLRGARLRLIVRLLAFSLIVSLAPISFMQQVSAAPIPVADCKLIDPFKYSVRLGFPKDPARLNSIGAQRVLLMAVDYSDAPTTDNATEALKLAFNTDEINEFFKSVSYGQLLFTFDIHPTVVRMPKTSSNYVGKLGNTYPQPIFVTNIMQDATTAAAGQVNFSTYQMVAILDLARIDSWGYWGFALPYNSPGFATPTGYVRNSTVIGAWEGNSKTALTKGYKTFVLKHEIGHLFGFVDLYIIAPGNYFIGQTPGPFDVMNSNGVAQEFLAWQRWLQGWVVDANVTCLAFSDPTATMQLKPLGKSSTGTQMTVVKISAQKALVLESRRGTATDQLNGNDGLLAYEIDLSVPTLQGPIKIVPKNSAATLAPLSPDLSDNERYLDATAQTGEYIRYKDILIENKLGNQDGESIQIYKGNAAADRQRELDNISRTATLAEFNRVKVAKANNTYYEAPYCIQSRQKFTFQTLDEKRVWKDLDTPIKFIIDATCYNASSAKPYIITQLPSRTFYRGKVTGPTGLEEYTGAVLTDAVLLSDKTQRELEITLAKLEDNYLLETSACHSSSTAGTLQIEREGVFIDFAPVAGLVEVKECSSFQNKFRPYVIARLATGTKYRFKSQAVGWDRDYFSQVYTKGKTVPELLAEVTQKSSELTQKNSELEKINVNSEKEKAALGVQIASLTQQITNAKTEIEKLNSARTVLNNELTAVINTLRTEKAALGVQIASLTQQITNAKTEIEKLNSARTVLNNELTAVINTLRTEKAELEGSVTTLRSQLVTSNTEIETLQQRLAQERSSFESVTGELITAKTKLEGDVVILQNENTTLKTKVESLSKTTITCVKGKTQRKITAIKPVCPSGFKKKN